MDRVEARPDYEQVADFCGQVQHDAGHQHGADPHVRANRVRHEGPAAQE